jgi:hypothetical protein
VSVLALLMVLLAGFAFMESTEYAIIVLLILFGIPVLAAYKKTWFTLKALDSRILTFRYHSIQLGTVFIRLVDVTNFSLYVRSYDGLRLFDPSSVSSEYIPEYSEYGDGNRIQFKYCNEVFDLTFLLGDQETYFALLEMASFWQQNYAAKVGCEFTYEEVSTSTLLRRHTIDP